VLGRIQAANGWADVIETLEDTSVVVGKLGNDPLKVDNLTLL
jgi:hypothetical protein